VTVQQRLVLMLAVHQYQFFAQFTDILQRYRRAVDITTGAAIISDGSTQQAFIAFVELPVCQPLASFGALLQGELRLNFGAIAAMAHDDAVGSLAESETQGGHDNRLARTGFTGNDRQTGQRLQFQGFDSCQIADTKISKHNCSNGQ